MQYPWKEGCVASYQKIDIFDTHYWYPRKTSMLPKVFARTDSRVYVL
jgi:hypothetical protein